MNYSYDEIKEIIKNVVIETNDVNIKIDELNENTNFINDLSFDSFNFIKMIVALEAQLDVIFTMDDLDINKMETLGQLINISYSIYINTHN
ncbi:MULTISPECIES: acyl carrier protein [Clostridium]|jgi:acyl carrier protein|uniref:Phosphopantetheine attachment site n=1 Tax=Clostridium saccharoperbutylacetonicum N1-4(HMT) TaxID=931276 RepID=M1MCI9_9CLOT|nr:MULTISPECIES: phosphopantetheine-binding protein [Clostridium]AGF54133.1 phosphopantetheine attachment site [Clostridium saccharoperbutylacetonicum N1-4(HMT)]AQR93035.1 acyl carrier protein [Clostridium saccharoperbutylacetonicum]NRT59353.1 acyl carrier protein [Clostridium saccharoperbutylacetonicum]NSB28544.1 acyl carrier protein [Clostridium saccharoperbutylacetonicum]NSB34446.1 acyl carrier protein [Clostridium saccharoperbutylacetonicum]